MKKIILPTLLAPALVSCAGEHDYDYCAKHLDKAKVLACEQIGEAKAKQDPNSKLTILAWLYKGTPINE